MKLALNMKLKKIIKMRQLEVDVLGGAAAIPVTKAEYHKNPCQMQNKRITPNNNILIIIE